MNDLVTRLRDRAHEKRPMPKPFNLLLDAAERISQQDAELERLRREVEASRVRIEALVRALRLAKDHAELEDEVLDIVDDALTINVTNQADECDHKGPLHFFSWGPCCGKCGEPYPFVAAEETGQ